jgi:uncharacterized membrane protein
MAIWSSRNKHFFSAAETEQIIKAIKNTEQQTSGEIRVFVESRCKFVDPLDRASEIFWALKMDQTQYHNAVLIYVAAKDHQFAIYADKGIYEKLGTEFWNKEVKAMSAHFASEHFREALLSVISHVGTALSTHFPYDSRIDKNELPDDIIFGN